MTITPSNLATHHHHVQCVSTWATRIHCGASDRGACVGSIEDTQCSLVWHLRLGQSVRELRSNTRARDRRKFQQNKRRFWHYYLYIGCATRFLARLRARRTTAAICAFRRSVVVAPELAQFAAVCFDDGNDVLPVVCAAATDHHCLVPTPCAQCLFAHESCKRSQYNILVHFLRDNSWEGKPKGAAYLHDSDGSVTPRTL